MGRAGAVIRPAPSLPGFGASVRAYALTAGSSLVVAFLVVAGAGPFVRLVAALVFAVLLVSLALTRPAAAVVATIVYLVLLAFMRRLLIPVTGGWFSADPMLLVGPLIAIVLLARLFGLERRRWAPDLLSKLVLAVLLLTIVEVANPSGNGVKAGITGLLFMAVPLLWFFVGRELVSDSLSDRLLSLVVVLGAAIGIYGVLQTQLGFPSWDAQWIDLGGFSSLNVGGVTRAFGTFSSFVEYGLFTGSALAVAYAMVLRGRAVAIFALPPLAVALFLASYRASLITTAIAIVVLSGLRTRHAWTAAIVTVCALGLGFAGLKVFGGSLSSAGGNSLVAHQLGGITDPLNPENSTLTVHFGRMTEGCKSWITHLLGQGPAVTNNASGVGGSPFDQTQATEIDFSNAFVALGLPGGVLYLATIFGTLFFAVRSYFAGREAMLPVIGLLIVGLGQWLTGGHYALSPLTWLLVGCVAAGATWRSRRTA
jgi:hypothetical protein